MEIEKILKLSIFSILLLISLALIALNKLAFSMDLQGGLLTLIKPAEPNQNLTQIAEIIQKRIEALGLAEHKVSINDSFIQILSLNDESIPRLIEEGRFEAKILRRIPLVNGSGEFILEEKHGVKVEAGKLIIENKSYGEGETFRLEEIEFKVLNLTNDSAFVEGLFFKNEDVKNVYPQLSYVRYNPDFKRWEFRIPVEISGEASRRFEVLTRNAGRRFVPGGFVLDADLFYYLNDKLTSSLPLPVQMAGRKLESITILGYDTRSLAQEKLEKIRLALETGELPKLEVKGSEKISPKIKMAKESFFAGIALFFLLSLLIAFKKYGKFGVYFSGMLASELLIIVGIASLTQIALKPGWIFDLFSIYGVFVFAFLSFLNYFSLSEKILRKKKFVLRYRFRELIEVPKLIKLLAFPISLILLFTPLKGFGLSILIGMSISYLTTSIYKDKLKIPPA